jgi:hypothetical protein
LLLQAGYHLSLHSAPRFNANQEKDIGSLALSPDGTHHARRGGKSKGFYLSLCASFFNSHTQKLKMLNFAKR